MRIVLATSGLSHPGGSETYVVVVAEQLERLGHEILVRAVERGPVADEAEGRGIRVALAGAEPPGSPDAVLVQDAPSSYELAELWPGVPQLFRACSDVHDFQLPPVLPGVVGCAVALSERVASRLRAMNSPPPIVRLRHPVDVRRCAPLRPIGRRPRRALLLGNYLSGPRLEALAGAWEAAGVACVRVGSPGEPTLRPEVAINDADIVVGKGRVVLEAMACGRAAYVYDFSGRDGWVTADRYDAMEADNFAGHATAAGVAPDALAADLAGYDARMGDVNRDLAVRHHHAARHAEQLVALLRELVPAPPPPLPADELARLGRRQWAAERDALLLRAELGRRAAALEATVERFRPAREELEALYADRARLEDQRDRWALRARRAEAEAERLRGAPRARGSRLAAVPGRVIARRFRSRP